MRSFWRSAFGTSLLFATLGGCEIVADFDRAKITKETTRPPGVAKPIPVPDAPPIRPDAGDTDGAAPDASLMDAGVDGGPVEDGGALDGGADAAVGDGGAKDPEDAAVDAGDAGDAGHTVDAAVDAGADAQVADAGSDAGGADAN